MNWVEAELASYSKVRTKKDLKDAVQRINSGEKGVDVDVYAYFGIGPGQSGIMGISDLLTYPELQNVGLVIYKNGEAFASVWNENGRLKMAHKASVESDDVCPYCGSSNIEHDANYNLCYDCGLAWGYESNPEILGSIDNGWLQRRGLPTSWTGGVLVHAADKGLMYPDRLGPVDVIPYRCEECGYTYHTYDAGP